MGSRSRARKSAPYLVLFLWVSRVSAQSCLVLSPAASAANGTVTLELSLFSQFGKGPAAVQWTFQYSSSSIASLIVDDGPALTAAGKTAMCYGNAQAYNCLAAGSNANTIANGIIAKLTATLVPGTTATAISIHSVQGASPPGYFVTVRSHVLLTPASVTPLDCQSRPPRRGPIRQ